MNLSNDTYMQYAYYDELVIRFSNCIMYMYNQALLNEKLISVSNDISKLSFYNLLDFLLQMYIWCVKMPEIIQHYVKGHTTCENWKLQVVLICDDINKTFFKLFRKKKLEIAPQPTEFQMVTPCSRCSTNTYNNDKTAEPKKV